MAAAPGECLSGEAPELAPFCDDNSTLTEDDTINQCFEAGWLLWSHNSLFDTDTVRLTDEGRAALSLTPGLHE